MDRIQNVKAQLRLEQWAERIAECQTSPMTVEAWCSAHDINVKTYYYWLRKVRKHTLENTPVAFGDLPAAANDTPVSFKSLEVQAPMSEMRAAVIIHLPAATVEVVAGTDQKTVEAVLLALKTVC